MDTKDRKIRNLERQLKELSELSTKNDEELRKKLMELRIANQALSCAMEFNIAQRLGIAIDVVLALMPEPHRKAVEDVIAQRVTSLEDTTTLAIKLAAKYTKETGEYDE